MQKKSHSLLESIGNTAIGFVLSVLCWEFVIKPIWHIPTTFSDNLQITAVFTVLSIARGYVLRRIGNRVTTKQMEEASRS